jgi:hypothetical protein
MSAERESMSSAVCALAAGQWAAWQGLQPFPAAERPACLQPVGRDGWLSFQSAPLAYQVFCHAASGNEVWLFRDRAEKICLVEVFPLPVALLPDPSLDPLGPPDLTYSLSLAARLQRPEKFPDANLQEKVFGRHGLAFLLLPTDYQPKLVRVRGFEPMPVQTYQERFVDLPPVRFFPD